MHYPVHEIKEWPNSEIEGWFEYLNRRPVGYRDDGRFYHILAALGLKSKPHEVFASLAAVEKDKQEREEADTEHNIQAQKLVNSGFLGKVIQDTGWDIEVK